MFRVTDYHDLALTVRQTPEKVEAVCGKDSEQDAVFFSIAPDFPVSKEDYVFLPACCYDGNRFDVLKKDYPPLFTAEEARIDMPVTVTDVPRLNKDGSGRLEVTVGDLAVPCVGIWSRSRKKAFLLFTVQQVNGKNLGITYENGEIVLSCPVMRQEAYVWPHMRRSNDRPAAFSRGETLTLPYRVIEADCSDLPGFFRLFFENRKCMGLDARYPEILPFAEQAAVQIGKFNSMSWFEPGEFYGVGTDRTSPSQIWQPGWVGGGMSSYALMKLGGPLEWERGLKTLKHLFSTQTPSGFFHETALEDGSVFPGVFGNAHAENWVLLRKSADALYFICKHFDLMEQRGTPIPGEYLHKTLRLADAFVSVWNRYGQMGQFADLQSGELTVGGSTGCASVGAALVRAYERFGREEYLQTAKACTEQYVLRDLMNGYTTGGPEEILQCPDSESAFGLLESLTELYRVTGEEVWLDRAKFCAEFCSSWVVAYNYIFPAGSEFARLDMKTVGAVFANLQNKHAAPGICTFSGDCLYRLWKWTGDGRYLELFRDITLTVSQYMSTDKRPIWSWKVPKDPTLSDGTGEVTPSEKLPQGFICERVNMSDWETQHCVGGVFNGSCWCETTNLLILAECAEFLSET